MSHPVRPRFADYLILRARRLVQAGLHALLLAITLASFGATAQTCLTAESESNNTDATADTGVCSGTPISGRISTGSDVDWYRLDVTGAGTLTISLAHASGVDFDWYLYPATGAYVAYGGTSNNPETGSYSVSAAGTYYLRVRRYTGTGNYTLTVTGPLPGSGGGGGGTPPPVSWPCTLPSGVNLGRTGSATDVSPATSGGFVLMGGGTDVDNALRWMIGKSGGGDVVVLRSTGTNAYNSYIYGLGTVNSVTTLLVDSTTEGDNACVAEYIRRAEMLFIAGGDQQNYITYFKGRAVGNAINHLVNTKRAPVGGTSAGMAILGQYVHPGGAPNDTTVLSNPTAAAITNNFISSTILANTVTDTHFSQRTREARLMAFMASTMYNFGVSWQNVRGIACDEATAYALEPDGTGKVFGANDCFFARPTGAPERLTAGQSLTWDLNNQALQVFVVRGTANATNTFNFANFTSINAAIEYWSSDNGVFTMQ
ncbi:MAG: pre-peptidase C-terminal domain-containing protein [Burkholderiales bacterium]|nr:pre-peptidase C-terminal domain-containing protein [Burkholderiales bacterium]